MDALQHSIEALQNLQNELQTLRDNQSKASSTSAIKVNKLFDDIAVTLNTQKQSILNELQQSEPDLISNNDDMAECNHSYQNSVYDHLSIWIQNKQLFEYMDKTNVSALQHDIIYNVFGGVIPLLNYLLQSRHTLDTLYQNKLYQTFVKYLNHSELFANYHTRSNQLSITNIPDECISSIMQFLGSNGRYIMQHCCRLFAINARHLLSLNNINNDLKAIQLSPKLSQIIQGILSNDNQQQTECMRLFKTYMTEYQWNMKRSIDRYQHGLRKRFINMVITSNTELGQDIAKTVGGILMLPANMKILKKAQQLLHNNDQNKIEAELSENCRQIMMNLDTYDVFVTNFDFQSLIPILCDFVKYRERFSLDEYLRHDLVEYCIWEMGDIAKFGFEACNQIFIQNDIFDILSHVIMDIRYDAFIVIKGLLKTPHLLNMEVICGKQQLLTEMVQNIQASHDCVANILLYVNEQQRMSIIDKIVSARPAMTRKICDKLLKALEMKGDEKAILKLREFMDNNTRSDTDEDRDSDND